MKFIADILCLALVAGLIMAFIPFGWLSPSWLWIQLLGLKIAAGSFILIYLAAFFAAFQNRFL